MHGNRVVLQVCVTEAVRDAVKVSADIAGMSISSFLRQAIQTSLGDSYQVVTPTGVEGHIKRLAAVVRGLEEVAREVQLCQTVLAGIPENDFTLLHERRKYQSREREARARHALGLLAYNKIYEEGMEAYGYDPEDRHNREKA